MVGIFLKGLPRCFRCVPIVVFRLLLWWLLGFFWLFGFSCSFLFFWAFRLLTFRVPWHFSDCLGFSCFWLFDFSGFPRKICISLQLFDLSLFDFSHAVWHSSLIRAHSRSRTQHLAIPVRVALWEGVYKLFDEPESPNEGACLRYMMNRHRPMRGVFQIYDEPESRNRESLIEGRVSNIWWTGIA